MNRIWPRLVVTSSTLLLLSAFVDEARSQDPPVEVNRQRLARMTIDQRSDLLKNLEEFESLPAAEQRSIETLDEKLAEAAPETRARYLSLLRRFHAFRQSLPEASRKAIDDENDPARKLALIAKLREAQKADALAHPMPYDNAFQISELSRVRLRPIARELVVWFSLDSKEDASEKAELGRMRDPAKRRAFALALARQKGLMGRVRDEEDEFKEAEADVRRTLPKPLAEKLLAEQVKAEAIRRQLNRGNGNVAGTKDSNPVENNRLRAVMKLDEIQVFRNLENEPVSTANLERFEKALPDWARETIDPLPPDAARRRLRVLYRLVFPTGTEMPEPKPEKKPKPGAARPPSAPRGRTGPVF